MDKRKQAILTHLGAYRFGLRTIIEDFVIGGDPGRELNELYRKDGHIKIWEHVLGTRLSVYQLTRAGAKLIGRPTSIAATRKAPSPQGLLANLSVLWFCFRGERKRFRLEPADEVEILGKAEGMTRPTRGSYHVLEPGTPDASICRVYVPSPRTGREEIETKLYQILSEAKKRPGADALLSAGRYTAVVLVQNKDRQRALSSFLKSRQIVERLPFSVQWVPDFVRQGNPLVERSDSLPAEAQD